MKRVAALSTDKAVNPVSLYGGTKLVSDKLFIAANAGGPGGTRFSVVRYGNVAGSRGSVIPRFRALAASGAAELPITGLEMTRFWISLEEGVELVLRALGSSAGGGTFVAKLPSFKVTDLAEAVLPGCAKREVGLREGEKLHEVMITREDAPHTLEYGAGSPRREAGSPGLRVLLRDQREPSDRGGAAAKAAERPGVLRERFQNA